MPSRFSWRVANRCTQCLFGAVIGVATEQKVDEPTPRVDARRHEAQVAVKFSNGAVDVAKRHQHLGTGATGGEECRTERGGPVSRRQRFLAASAVAREFEEFTLDHRVLDKCLRDRRSEQLGALVRRNRLFVGRARADGVDLEAQRIALSHIDRAVEQLGAKVARTSAHRCIESTTRIIRTSKAQIALGKPHVHRTVAVGRHQRLEIDERELVSLDAHEHVND